MRSSYENAVGSALLRLLQEETRTASLDERLFEGLMIAALNSLPAFEEKLGLPARLPGATYSHGGRGFPDLIRRSEEGNYEVGIEVKLRSAHNLQHPAGGDRWQLDVYADNAQDDSQLFVVATPRKVELLNREFDGYGQKNPIFETRSRWNFISTTEVRESMSEVLGSEADLESDSAKLVAALARLRP
jgi:hypothetical protein